MTHELLGQLAARKEKFTQNPISVEQMGELIDMVQNGNITGPYALLHLDMLKLTLSPKELRVNRFCAI